MTNPIRNEVTNQPISREEVENHDIFIDHWGNEVTNGEEADYLDHLAGDDY